MKKTILFFLLISAFAIFAFCMEPLPVQMGGTYGLPRGSTAADDAGSCLAETSSGGFIICGQNIGDWSIHILVICIDKDGKLTWSKEFGNYDSYVYSITKTQDNAFIMVGYSYEVGMLGAIAIKFDESGNLIWQKAFGPNAWVYDIKALSDGNYLLLGGMLNESYTKYFGLLIKMDKDGNVIWEKKGELGENLLAFYGAIEHPEGGLLIWGSGFLIKYDDGGNIVWARKIYDPYRSDRFNIDIWDAIILQNGDIIASYTNRYDSEGYKTIVRLTKEGNSILWKKSIFCADDPEPPELAPFVYKLYPKGNGKYMALASNAFFEFDESGEVDKDGYIHYTPFFNSYFLGFLWGPIHPVIITSDGNIAYCGASLEYVQEKGEEIGLIKTGSQNATPMNCTSIVSKEIVADSDAQYMEISDVCDLTITEINLLCSDLSGTDFARESSATGVNTFCPIITQVNKLQNPFRLEVIGYGLCDQDGGYDMGTQVLINGNPVPVTTMKSVSRVIAKKGDALKSMLPKGVPVCIQVRAVNSAGQEDPLFKSDCFYFTR